jgi:hypothetical protein
MVTTTPSRTPLHPGIVFVASILVPCAILQIGFRIMYDDVIPEAAGLFIAGAAFASLNPRRAWLSTAGIAIGIFLSEWIVPVPAPAAHLARYGAPVLHWPADFLKLCAIPGIGAAVGAIARLAARAL